MSCCLNSLIFLQCVIGSDNFESFVPVCHVFNGNRHKPFMNVYDLFKKSIADKL